SRLGGRDPTAPTRHEEKNNSGSVARAATNLPRDVVSCHLASAVRADHCAGAEPGATPRRKSPSDAVANSRSCAHPHARPSITPPTPTLSTASLIPLPPLGDGRAPSHLFLTQLVTGEVGFWVCKSPVVDGMGAHPLGAPPPTFRGARLRVCRVSSIRRISRN